MTSSLRFLLLTLSLALLSALTLAPASSAQMTSSGTDSFGLPYERWNASDKPKGTVLIIHGGGWKQTDQMTLDRTHYVASRFQGRGWNVIQISYREGGEESLQDVKRWYRLTRRKHGESHNICTYGESAGGHLALLLAEQRNVQCTITVAAPTDLLDFTHPDPQFAAHSQAMQDFTFRVFGPSRENMISYSPVFQTATLKGRVLMANATNDPLVPITHARRVRSKKPAQVKVITLRPGTRAFGHSYVSESNYKTFVTSERLMMARIAL